MTVRVRTNPLAVERLLNERGTRRLVEAKAAEIAADAAAMAPVRFGVLRRSYTSTKARITKSGVVASAYTWSRIGHIIEWGSIRQAPVAPLRRAAARSGLRRRDYPKGAR